jgi:hypothetical protein
VVSITNIIKSLHKENKQILDIAYTKLDFETTRLFLEYHIKTDSNLDKLIFNDLNLYYDNNLLLQNVTVFEKIKNNNFMHIKICIKYSLLICQDMIFGK